MAHNNKYSSRKYLWPYFLINVMIILDCSCYHPFNKEDVSYVAEIQKWHRERLENLKAENGVLSVSGLFWLREGENKFGSDSANDIVLTADKVPDFIGSFILNKGIVKIKVNPGIEVMNDGEIVGEMILKNDMDSSMTTLTLEDLNWFVIKRNNEIGIRFRDYRNPLIRQFKGINMFNIDPAWRINAHFEPYDTVKMISSVTASGSMRSYPSPGALIFRIKNRTYRLDPIAQDDQENLFVIFGDATNGNETYGGGRFLYVEKSDENNTAILDFNKSINPPCAFSGFFVCPLPPPQNRLPVRVAAGEKKYSGSIHQ